MKLYNLYLMSSNNAGDKAASPLDYFEFPIHAEKVDVANYDKDTIADNIIIYGGGGLVHLPSPDYNSGDMTYLRDICTLSTTMLTWGVGHNIHGLTEIKYPEYFKKAFDVHGVRDYRQDQLPWVPCASCMHPYLKYARDNKSKRKHVAVGHKLHSYHTLNDIPKMHIIDTETVPFMRFISQAETVLTNSYHGAFWGLLMNRKVIVFDPLSSKFYGLPKEIKIATPETWMHSNGTQRPEFLSECRARTRQYYEQVLDYISEVTQ